MDHPSAYRNKEVLIIGLARSGQAVAEVFHRLGANVTVNDIKERRLCPAADILERTGITVVCGSHPPELVHAGVALVVKNPGIKYNSALVARALELGVEVVTEVEVAYRLSVSPIIGITGSNGKTTTTTWVGRMLEQAGKPPIVAGNIGRPLCDAVAEADPGQWLVAELSSFQLKGTKLFRPRIACLLNLVETHLDYHLSMEDYAVSKAKLFANQTSEDVAVLNWDDVFARELSNRIKAKTMFFSAREKLQKGVYVASRREEDAPAGTDAPTEYVVYNDGSGEELPIAPVRELGIVGKHNLENGLAAAAIAIAAEAPLQAIGQALRAFRGVEHRLEFVGQVEQVAFYNDSKATNPSATIKALQSFEREVVWIAGGLDRGSDYMELLPWLGGKVKAVVTLGQTREKIRRVAAQAGIRTIETVDTANNAPDAVTAAVQAAYRLAEAGDVVLFSPACASWDMFSSFEERGSMFKQSVHNLN